MVTLTATLITTLFLVESSVNQNKAITEAALRELYVNQQLSTIATAEELKASPAAIYQALVRFDIPRRSKSQAALHRYGQTVGMVEKDRLRELYIDQQMSGISIAKKLGIDPVTVYNALGRFNIPLRSRSDASKQRWSRTWKADWKKMARQYEKGTTLEDIAKEVGCSLGVASSHLRDKGIELRPRSFKSHSFSPNSRRAIAHAIGADRCAICTETRGTQLCHIQARRKGGPLNPDNTLPLCPSHHWFFDRGQLTKAEVRKIQPVLLSAKRKSYTHHVYTV